MNLTATGHIHVLQSTLIKQLGNEPGVAALNRNDPRCLRFSSLPKTKTASRIAYLRGSFFTRLPYLSRVRRRCTPLRDSARLAKHSPAHNCARGVYPHPHWNGRTIALSHTRGPESRWQSVLGGHVPDYHTSRNAENRRKAPYLCRIDRGGSNRNVLRTPPEPPSWS
jgi:hypothetical protein